MAEPIIKERKNLKLWLRYLPLVIILIAIILCSIKSIRPLVQAGEKSVYNPSESGAGFVAKANELFNVLLAEVDDNVKVTSLETLNKRYPALEFALPYDEYGREYIEASDLRLVRIRPEHIKDDKLKRFYYNSRLPQLLQRQQEQLGETFFKIKTRGLSAVSGGKRTIEVTSITLIPSMFKVALAHLLWDGTIESMPNCLFNDSTSLYISYGNTVLPIHQEKSLRFGNNDVEFNAIMDEGILLSDRLRPINYYDYYKKVWEANEVHSIRLNIRGNKNSKVLGRINICYYKDSLFFSRDCGLLIVGNSKAVKHHGQKIIGHDKPSIIPVADGMKVLVYNQTFNRKYGEFTIHRHNPLLKLSTLVRSSMGTKRYYVSESQTDLFTQQLLRGLTRHVSNRDSDHIDKIMLTIDPLLSREFENEIKDYLSTLRQTINADSKKPHSQTKEQYDMSVTIMDMATGNVLASPFYTTKFERRDFPDALRMTTKNTSLTRRSVGSTFKPLVALASVMSTPSLIKLNTSGNNKYKGPADWNKTPTYVDFFGHRTKAWARGSSYHWEGCDFTTFLGRSDDVFPVGLATLAMSGRHADVNTKVLPIGNDNDFFEVRDSLLRFKNAIKGRGADLVTYPFTSWLSYLYSIRLQEQEGDEISYSTSDIHVFDQLFNNNHLDEERKSYGLQEISPDQTQLRLDRFLDGDDFRIRMVPWVLGQGDNMWNCIKLAEAWCRMIGKYDINATFVRPANAVSSHSLVHAHSATSPLPLTNNGITKEKSVNDVWNQFLEIFSNAQSYRDKGATLYPMFDKVAVLNKNNGTSLKLFSKTGTPDVYARYEFPLLGGNNRYTDVGLYTFALVDDKAYKNIQNNKQGKGIVCVVRITRSYECRKCTHDKQCDACKGYWGVKSSDARDFFASPETNLLQKLYDMTKYYYR